MATKYWAGTNWILADGSITSAPGVSDVGILGGILPGFALAQSGTVGFFGLSAAVIGTLEIDGTGTWTIAGTGGVGNRINSLNVATGATVTVNSQVAVRMSLFSQPPVGVLLQSL